jgi:hypothetical protein
LGTKRLSNNSKSEEKERIIKLQFKKGNFFCVKNNCGTASEDQKNDEPNIK